MARPSAILHIGTEKTGTTSLQAFLSANRAALEQNGFRYARFAGDDNHRALAAYASADSERDDLRQRFEITSAADLAGFRARLEAEAEAEIAAYPEHTFILSNEHCSSRLITPEDIARLKALLDRLFSRVEIALYLRRQDRVAVSFYSTQLLMGSPEARLLPEGDELDFYYDYEALLARWAEAFGRARVHPALFEPESLTGGSVTEDFAARWGLGGGLQPVARHNASLRPEAQALLDRLNAAFPPVIEGRANPLRGDLANVLAASHAGPGRRPSRAQVEAFLARHEASNDAVRRTWFPEREHLFDADFEGYPEHDSDPEPDFATLADMAGLLWRHARTAELRQRYALAISNGQLAELQGDTKAAAEHYRTALALDAEDPLAARHLALLEAVEDTPPPPPPRKRFSLNGLRRLLGRPAVGRPVLAQPTPPDPSQFWTGPRPEGALFFLHIPKTAGTSVSEALRQGFHPDEICPEYEEHHLIRADTQALRARYRYFAAHAGFDVAERLGEYIVTVLRDPEARIISLYNYWRQQGQRVFRETAEGPANEGVRLAATQDFETFLSTQSLAVRLQLANTQAYMLAATAAGVARKAMRAWSEEAVFARAADNLRSLDAIGLTDDLQVFESALEERLGLRLGITHTNRTRQQTVRREELSETAKELLAGLTTIERRLVAAVRSGEIRAELSLAEARRARLMAESPGA